MKKGDWRMEVRWAEVRPEMVETRVVREWVARWLGRWGY